MEVPDGETHLPMSFRLLPNRSVNPLQVTTKMTQKRLNIPYKVENLCAD